jgi:holliday junction DNA helicase RuvA
MIGQINGRVLSKSPTEAVVDVGGVGYMIHIPVTTFERLPDIGEKALLYTYLHVREDALLLYGFHTKEEKELFRKLIGVSGVGPKLAQTVMSGMSYDDLIRAIREGNTLQLNKIPGVGKKTAERLVVELKDPLAALGPVVSAADADSPPATQAEALLALTTLGYSRAASENAIRTAIAERNGNAVSLEELIKSALRRLSR